MHRLPLKALSLNAAYRGRRFITPELKKYKEDVARLAPRLSIPSGKLHISYVFGVSSKNSDADNLVKCTQDSLAERYGFNDRVVYSIDVKKMDVKRGEEYIEFEIINI